MNNEPSDAPGTFAASTSPALTAPADVVGAPVVNLHLTAPVAAQTQAGGPSGQLVLFAKVYDVAPDGTKVLKNRLISPMRVADVTKTVTVKLPGIVHRFAAGHRIQVVVAASDFAYAGNTVAQPVTISTSPRRPARWACPWRARCGSHPSDRRPLGGLLLGEVLRDPAGDLAGGRTGGEDLGDADLLEGGDVLRGHDAAAEDDDVAASRSSSRATSLRKSVMCAPSTERPIRSASSWIAVSTICSGVWWRPV